MSVEDCLSPNSQKTTSNNDSEMHCNDISKNKNHEKFNMRQRINKKFGTGINESCDSPFTNETKMNITKVKGPITIYDDMMKSNIKTISCKLCNGDHLTSFCPDQNAPEHQQKKMFDGSNNYHPPHDTTKKMNEHTIRISNLTENCTEADLIELCKMVAKTTRIFIAKDKKRDKSRGFAFISFESHAEAEKALKTFQGYAYDHLLLNVDWARQND